MQSNIEKKWRIYVQNRYKNEAISEEINKWGGKKYFAFGATNNIFADCIRDYRLGKYIVDKSLL